MFMKAICVRQHKISPRRRTPSTPRPDLWGRPEWRASLFCVCVWGALQWRPIGQCAPATNSPCEHKQKHERERKLKLEAEAKTKLKLKHRIETFARSRNNKLSLSARKAWRRSAVSMGGGGDDVSKH